MDGILAGKLNIAVDIGTTTISVSVRYSVPDAEKSSIELHKTTVNSSRRFGADIISRMDSAVNGHLYEISDMMRRDVREQIMKIADIQLSEGHIMIACNTGLFHMILGVFPAGLIKYPFTPSLLSVSPLSASDLFGPEFERFKVSFVPCISSFVGGDIVAGMVGCGFDNTDEVNLLIDMGTNAEIAIGNSTSICVASAAAGPAFEGGNMECGTACVPGAVTEAGKAYVKDGSVLFSYIKLFGYEDVFYDVGPESEIPCTGICGTGYFEIISRLTQIGVITANGSFSDLYRDTDKRSKNKADLKYFVVCKGLNGLIYLSVYDVRNFLLAKASVRAGVECLMQRYGVTTEDIGKVYIGGAFSRIMHAKELKDGDYCGNGFISPAVLPVPPQLRDRVVSCRNTSLAGTVAMLKDDEKIRSAEHLVSVASEFELAGNEVFGTKYIEALYF